jgi:hypothetical protein
MPFALYHVPWAYVRTASRQNLKALDVEKKEDRVESRYVYDVKTTTRLRRKREEM